MPGISKTRLNSTPERPQLYCVWIKANDAPDSPLVSVWIDPQMRAFDQLVQENNSHIAHVAGDLEKVIDEPPKLTIVYDDDSLYLIPVLRPKIFHSSACNHVPVRSAI